MMQKPNIFSVVAMLLATGAICQPRPTFGRYKRIDGTYRHAMPHEPEYGFMLRSQRVLNCAECLGAEANWMAALAGGLTLRWEVNRYF